MQIQQINVSWWKPSWNNLLWFCPVQFFRSHRSSLTSSAATVRQGQCFLVSLTLTDLAFWTVFRALDRFSGVTSRQISLSSEDTPSIWYSSKKLACREEEHTGLAWRIKGSFTQITNRKITDGTETFSSVAEELLSFWRFSRKIHHLLILCVKFYAKMSDTVCFKLPTCEFFYVYFHRVW